MNCLKQQKIYRKQHLIHIKTKNRRYNIWQSRKTKKVQSCHLQLLNSSVGSFQYGFRFPHKLNESYALFIDIVCITKSINGHESSWRAIRFVSWCQMLHQFKYNGKVFNRVHFIDVNPSIGNICKPAGITIISFYYCRDITAQLFSHT